jgi:protein phosphatase
MERLKIIADGITDIGKVKQANQDKICLFHQWNVFVVADGMGGHAGGGVASGIAVDTIHTYFTENRDSNLLPSERLLSAIRESSLEIAGKGASDKKYLGMGTTIVAMLIDRVTANVAHVGDSRAYIIRDAGIRQITSDHSLVNQYIGNGLITKEQAKRHPLKNVLTRALGMSRNIDVDITSLQIKAGDIFILCSDGLTNMIEDEDILNTVISCGDDIPLACRSLVDLANNKGGEDNISVVIVKCTEA